jgi:hypothetical protein
METDPARAIEHDADELEERVGRLEQHIDESRSRLQERAAEAQHLGEAEDLVGDWEGKERTDWASDGPGPGGDEHEARAQDVHQPADGTSG